MINVDFDLQFVIIDSHKLLDDRRRRGRWSTRGAECAAARNWSYFDRHKRHCVQVSTEVELIL